MRGIFHDGEAALPGGLQFVVVFIALPGGLLLER